jgi:predicted DNA-binding transcriptional regulator YafY
MSSHRQFELLYLLLDQPVITAKELARHFEVSTRTIYRDVDLLSSAGIPIYATRGKEGGISLLDEYTLDSTLFSSAEREKILTGLQTLESIGYPHEEGLLKKVGALFQIKSEHWLSIDFSSWGSSESQKQLFTQLRQAIIYKKVITFLYTNNNGEQTKRRVEPTRLHFKQRGWYVYAFCLSKHAFRWFKLSRIEQLGVTEDSFSVDPSVELNTDFSANNDTLPFRLSLSSDARYRVFDEFPLSSITKKEDGSFIIHHSLPSGKWLEEYLFSFGDLLLDIEPPELKDTLRSKAIIMSQQLN